KPTKKPKALAPKPKLKPVPKRVKAVAVKAARPKIAPKAIAEPEINKAAVPIETTEESVKKVPETSERQLEDKALVRRARAGEQRAYSELVKRHKRGIERLIRPITRNATTDEVEDLVQEAFTKAFLHLSSYSEEYAFSTWLYRIATNHAIDYLRRKKLSVFSISAPPGGGDKGEDESKDFEIVDTSWIPEQLMLSEERSQIIENAIEQLPENYKKIIKLRHNDDLEYDEIAKVLNLPMGTVKVHLHRARAALGKMLEGKV
ncbi:MAG: sigma-70 family RNA polymerase sigma factor, partial [Bacteroidota bacterium]|nr:sigma-70 family RNA polymerase sigma factor [Bacteroidota bacterium]